MPCAMPPPIAPRLAGGFSLLEMLVALTVLGFLMVGLNQGVHTGMRLWAAQSRQIGVTSDLDAVARLLRTSLTGIPIQPFAAVNPGAVSVAIFFKGTASQLSFVGDLPTGLGGTQRAEINLRARDNRLLLSWVPRRHEVRGAKPAATETELLRGVADLELAYWSASSPGAPAGWRPRWDGPALPALIRLRLTFISGDRRRWPEMVVAPQLWSPAL
jgi:general secretion pathway protein J